MYTDAGTLSMIIAALVAFGMTPFYFFRHKIIGGIKGWFNAKRKKQL